MRGKNVSLGKQETKGNSWSDGRTNKSTTRPSANGVSVCENRQSGTKTGYLGSAKRISKRKGKNQVGYLDSLIL